MHKKCVDKNYRSDKKSPGLRMGSDVIKNKTLNEEGARRKARYNSAVTTNSTSTG